MIKLPKGNCQPELPDGDRAVGECDANPGEEPLVCSCGAHSAKFVPPKKKQPARWMVLAVKVPGQKPQPVTTLTKEKALQRVRLICASSSAPTETTTNPTTTGAPAEPQHNLRKRTAMDYDDTVRLPSLQAGSGRGHKRQADVKALKTAQAVLKKPKTTNEELRDALCKLTEAKMTQAGWAE